MIYGAFFQNVQFIVIVNMKTKNNIVTFDLMRTVIHIIGLYSLMGRYSRRKNFMENLGTCFPKRVNTTAV